MFNIDIPIVHEKIIELYCLEDIERDDKELLLVP